MSDEATNTIELPEVETESATKMPDVPTRADLKEKGWSAKELDSAEKRGMIQKKEEKAPEKKADEEDVKPEATGAKENTKPEESKDAKATEKKEEAKEIAKRLNGNLPDFKLTPEQEKVFLDSFGPGTQPRAMYFRMKNERQARQAAEAERDRIALQAKDYEDQLAALRQGKVNQLDVDENGNPIDPEDRPLTLKQWKELQKQEAEEKAKQEAEYREKGGRVAEALKTQEEYAKSMYADFDETVKLASELVNNLDELIPEKWKQEKVIKLMHELQAAAAQADKKGLDDYNAPMISYELGQLHPNYGKANGQRSEDDNDGKPTDPNKANGSLTPEQMKRLEANTQRRVSSASIPGSSGRRVVSVDDVTIKDVLKMSSEQREDFKRKYPAKWQQFLRG